LAPPVDGIIYNIFFEVETFVEKMASTQKTNLYVIVRVDLFFLSRMRGKQFNVLLVNDFCFEVVDAKAFERQGSAKKWHRHSGVRGGRLAHDKSALVETLSTWGNRQLRDGNDWLRRTPTACRWCIRKALPNFQRGTLFNCEVTSRNRSFHLHPSISYFVPRFRHASRQSRNLIAVSHEDQDVTNA